MNNDRYNYPYAQENPSTQYADYPTHDAEDGLLRTYEAEKTPWYKNKWVWLPAIALVVIGIGVGVGVGVGVTNNNSSSSDSSASSNSDSSDPNDPSNFDKDPNLHKSFWALAYTPQGSIMPDCGATSEDVIKDMQMISQVTTRLRLYGSDCNQSALVLDAIQRTKVDLNVWLGIYLEEDNEVYTRQRDEVINVLDTYGTDHVNGIVVGNEYLLNNAPDGGTALASNSTVQYVVDSMEDMRNTVADKNYDKDLPIGTADAGSQITTQLAEGSDFIMANVHPYFGGVSVDEATAWTVNYFQENSYAQAMAASNQPPIYLAETGWPSDAMEGSSSQAGGAAMGDSVGSTYGAAEPGLEELQTFLDAWVCQANSNISSSNGNSADGAGYFWFEAFDEPWKEMYGGVEPYWGVFDRDRNLKNITIPDCEAP